MAGSIDFQLALRNLMSSNARSLDTERELAVYKGDLLLTTFYWVCVQFAFTQGLFVRSLNRWILGYRTIKPANKDQS